LAKQLKNIPQGIRFSRNFRLKTASDTEWAVNENNRCDSS